jgi:ABC-type transport system substrate-binding protein
MLWTVGNIAADPDGQSGFQRFHSKQIGGQNFARIKLPALDAMYEKLSELPDSPERKALFEEMRRLSLVHMAYKPTTHRRVSDLVQPWVIGYRRPLWWQEWWHVVDLSPERDSPA